VWVSVADHRQVEVICGTAAGQHGVELLPRLRAGSEAVHGLDGDALGGVHCGVAELGGCGDVAGRYSDDAAVLCGCRTFNPLVSVTLRTVHRSPFFTQSVPLMRSRRAF
jgi:hypothetical protein